ncbi:MAG: helix-turn-helix domain-containing protein [Polyangiaceae bacterium]|nr:helix-turn-helix domain-containing protein [Polyangiaceae bacterium]
MKRLSGDTVRQATSGEVKDLRVENSQLKEVVAEVVLKNRVLKKKSDGTWRGGRCARRSASEKHEMSRLVENSDLPARTTLKQLGIPRSTFYGWYERYLTDGVDGLEDRKPRPRRFWNRIPPRIRDAGHQDRVGTDGAIAS